LAVQNTTLVLEIAGDLPLCTAPPPLRPGPVLLYTKMIGAAPTGIVVVFGTTKEVKGSFLPESENWTGVAAPPHVPLI